MEIIGNISTTESPITGATSAIQNAGNTPSILADLVANQPAAGTIGRLFVATDTGTFYRDTGSVWNALGGAISSISTTSSGLSISTVSSATTINLSSDLNAISSLALTNGFLKKNASGTWEIMPAVTAVADLAVSNTLTYITPSFPIAANTITAGDAFKITIFGTATTGNAAAGTFAIRFGIAGTTTDAALLTPSVTPSSNGTNIPFQITILVTFRTTTTAMVSFALQNFGVTGIAATTNNVASLTTAATVATNVATFLGMSYNSNNTNNTATFRQVLIEKVS